MPILGFGTSGITKAAPIEQAIVQVGYRHIDTAMKYDNEEVVGEACQNAIKSGVVKRGDLFITTKIWHFDYQNPEKALRTSLKKLKMDYVDLYLIHWPNNYQYTSSRTPMHVLWAKLEKLVAKGLTRGIGLSNFNTQFVGDILTYAKVRPVVNQIQIYPCYAQTGFIKFLRKQGIVPVAYSPIGRPGASFGPISHVNLREEELIIKLAKKYKRTPVQILLNWGLSRGYAVIPMSQSLGHQ